MFGQRFRLRSKATGSRELASVWSTNAALALLLWWKVRGSRDYPQASRLLITADAGGSNGYRYRVWKSELAALAAETGLAITVCHFPPGTSKWNKVEHRLFSFISISWRGRPLTDYQVVVQTIAATTTRSGLTVEAVLDTNTYPTGVRVSPAQQRAIPLQKYAFHGEWNYVVHCGPIPESLRDKAITLEPIK